MMSRSQPRKGARFLLKVGQYLCLILALVCLGYIGLDYARARIFQAYQSWRFDRVIGHKPPSEVSMLMGWVDRALSSFMKQPVARPNQDRFQPDAPPLAGQSSVGPIHIPTMGALLGRMEIPRIGISVMVLEGDGDDVLRKAVGHVPTTALLGGSGNVVIAGHRDTFFRNLRKIRTDDEIIITTTQGVYNYQVGSIKQVGAQDVQVLKPSGSPMLTLVTCYPFDYIGPAPKRFIVQARETQSSRSGQQVPSLSRARLTLDSHSTVRSTSSTRRKKARLDSLRSPSDSSPQLNLTTLTRSSRVMEGSESTQETTEAHQVDPPTEPLPKSHQRLRRVRTWLGSIPRRL